MANNCVNISVERIRARLTFGTPLGPGSLVFETPDVKAFSVSRSRSSLAAQFSASIEVPATTVFPIGEDIVIEAGTLGNLKRIFTGQVRSITANVSFENASRYVVNLAGADRFVELEGKNISRRQRARALSSFAAITGLSSRVPQKGISIERRSQSGDNQQIVSLDTNIREHSKLVRTDRVAWDPYNGAKDPEAIEGRETSSGSTVIDIKPKSVALSPGVSVLFSLGPETTYQSGDSWAVSDSAIGRITDRGNGTAVYTQLALGENTVVFTKNTGETSGSTGRAVAIGVPLHAHDSLGGGGPAHGVYSAD